jgi:hypothetical protein
LKCPSPGYHVQMMMPDNNVRRVVHSILNDSKIREQVFSSAVHVALRDGYDDNALNTIREVIPVAAQQVRADLSPDEMERVAQIILERARKIQ